MFITTDLVRVQTPMPPSAFPGPAVQDRLADLWADRKSANTRRGYASDWRQFQKWCFAAGQVEMPATPQTIAQYLDHLMTAKTPRGGSYARATIERHIAAIGHMHNERGAVNPCADRVVVGLMEGMRRRLAGRPSSAKAAVLVPHLRKGLRIAPVKPADFRNRALLLVGFAGAFRRSELVGIDVEHLAFSESGAVCVTLPKSKTDQTGEGQTVWIMPAGALCPVRALREWLAIAGITAGPVFRSIDRHKNIGPRISTDLVPYIVKRFAAAAGLDPAQFSGHSLRAGLVTQSFINQLPIELIQQQTRHRTVDVLLRYRRENDKQTRNVSGQLGL